MPVQSSPEARLRPRPDAPLRIALVAGPRGGARPDDEGQALRDQAAALRRIGCEVSILGAGGDARPRGLLGAARARAEVAIGLDRCPERELRRLRPHVVHVHNPAFALGWLRRWTGPLIATVHGRPPIGTPLVPPTGTTRCGTATDPLLARADRIAVPSQLGWDLCRKAGLPVERLALVPDFAPPAPPTGVAPDCVGRWVYVGRLSRPKGVVEMLRHWPATEPLDIVGDGVLADECRRVAPPSVRFLGALEREETRRRMPWWTGLVFPTRRFDGAPSVYPEALAAGLPVVAWAGSSVAYGVRLHDTGAVVDPGDRLPPVLAQVRHERPWLRERCHQVYRTEFSEERWAERTLRVYQQAAQRRLALSREPLGS
jgi:glycosyltransferase involved in cell wall biosynthesis